MTQATRVLFIDETRPIAGGANSLLLLLAGVDQGRFEPILIAPKGQLATAAQRLGILTLPHAFRYLRLTTRLLGRKVINPIGLWFRFWDALRFAKIVHDYRIAIIHTNTLNAHISGLLAARLIGIPVIWHVRRIYAFSSILFRQKWLPDRVIFVSEAARDAAVGTKYSDRVCVIHNGIDLTSFVRDPDAYLDVRQEFGIKPTERIVGSVGRLDIGKGYEYLVDAARVVLSRHDDVRFMIVGEGQYGEKYAGGIRRQIAELGMQDSVILTGFRADVARLVSAFDVFVSPSVRDAHPRVVLEAMALGLPIVGTLSGGIAETLEDGRSGLLVPVRDSLGLAVAINRILDDPHLAHDLGRNACEQVSSHFTAETYIANVESVYDSFAARR